jgi:tripartite-type tricarboxylate transporter receptor subunit TctC
MKRRNALLGLGSALLAGTATSQPSAAEYPTRPIRLILPLPPGSMTDTVARVLAPELQRLMGQPLVIDNRAGAGGLIAFQAVKSAPADGYTLGIVSPSTWREPVQAKLPYDALRDFTYICCISETVFGVTVPADSPFKTWRELQDYGKQNQDKVSYAVAPGLGQSPHFFIEEVARHDGVKWLPVPYKGANESTAALLGGQVTFSIDPLLATNTLVRAGKLRYLFVARGEPVKGLPNVPSMKQLGYSIVIDAPLGIAGPAGLPEAVSLKLQHAFRAALDAPSVVETLERADQPRRFLEAGPFRQLVEKNIAENAVLLDRYMPGRKS